MAGGAGVVGRVRAAVPTTSSTAHLIILIIVVLIAANVVVVFVVVVERCAVCYTRCNASIHQRLFLHHHILCEIVAASSLLFLPLATKLAHKGGLGIVR